MGTLNESEYVAVVGRPVSPIDESRYLKALERRGSPLVKRQKMLEPA